MSILLTWTKENILYKDSGHNGLGKVDDLDDLDEPDDFEDYNEDDEDEMSMFPRNMLSLNNVFNLWNLHTNFKITEDIFNIVKDFDGVEISKALTPYRMKVGFGFCFDDVKIRKRLDNAIISHLERRNE